MSKTLIFSDSAFPGYANMNFNHFEGVCLSTAKELKTELLKDYDVFVNMHGGHFPFDAVSAYYDFLKKGKGYVQCFGTPLEYVYEYDENLQEYICKNKQMSYYRKLNIHSVLNVSQQDVISFLPNEENPVAKELCGLLSNKETLNFIIHPTKNAYVESEWGSIGSMDTRMIPLVKGMNESSQHISSPIILMENRAGEYAGSRWIFVNVDFVEAMKDKFLASLKPLIEYTEKGYREIWVKPSAAFYYQGEKPSLSLTAQNFKIESDWEVLINVYKGKEKVWTEKETLEGRIFPEQKEILLDFKTSPGIYKIHTEWISKDGEVQRKNQGFCVQNQAVYENNMPINCGRDYFIIDGKMQAVVGTTYMSGEVSRSFLQIPNVYNWMEDMLEMKRVGINWLRTGIWCNHRKFMLDDGHFDEFILRSIDAFVECAATVGLHVTFTFFTFVPEGFEGSHPYLDRRSLEAQKRFIAKIVTRHKNTTNIDWDLINEPFTSDHPSQVKKISDCLEDEDFRRYIERRYKTVTNLLWNLDFTTPEISRFEDLPLPKKENINFDVTDMAAEKNGSIWVDYTKYRVEFFERWMLEMKNLIHTIAPGQLVTVGQDEALRAQRPSQLLYGKKLDYNAQHTWWLLDDLVWDTRFTKVEGKPLVVQETGIMYAEAPNGVPRRTEEDLAKLLRRKFAYAYGTKCAGAIHWLWNTNYFMNNANESNIGAIRCDGSRKPEFFCYQKFARFFRKAEKYISDIEKNDQVAVIFPYSNDFSNRSFAQHSTTHLTKILTDRLKISFIGISEFDLLPLRENDFKVIFLPSPHHFDTTQFYELVEIIKEKGGTLVFTGPMSCDEHFIKTDRIENLVGKTRISGISRYENITYKNKRKMFSFDHTYVSKAYKEESCQDNNVSIILGKGKILWFNIPLELTSETDKLADLYSQILKENGVETEFEITMEYEEFRDSIFISKINWKKGSLYTLVNESSIQQSLTILDKKYNRKYEIKIEAEDVSLFVVDQIGKVVSTF